MHWINYSEDDMEAAAEHNLDQYDSEVSVEGTVLDMLDNLDGHNRIGESTRADNRVYIR
ncbi:hypothetical protein [Halosimplex halobium]|uniref:hypothetical protein n=1 Tax=Halosimplex halobium TaxID=3396618 RepID=UPI003F568A8D